MRDLAIMLILFPIGGVLMAAYIRLAEILSVKIMEIEIRMERKRFLRRNVKELIKAAKEKDDFAEAIEKAEIIAEHLNRMYEKIVLRSEENVDL